MTYLQHAGMGGELDILVDAPRVETIILRYDSAFVGPPLGVEAPA